MDCEVFRAGTKIEASMSRAASEDPANGRLKVIRLLEREAEAERIYEERQKG